ncbi:MAG: hypothetical protein J2P58_14135, partial [Acidimicrobiaceae bacterium]|nr:hypothetical protein [Acidimicrobiaceae bacterium]
MEIKAPARLRGVPGRPSSAHAGDGKGGHGNGGHHSGGGGSRGGAGRDRYKWVALTNTTVGVLLVMIDSSIVMIAMPAIFRGIHLNPLQ